MSVPTSQLSGAFLGGATIVLTGLLGGTIVSRPAGLIVAGLVAVSPMVIAVDGSLMADALTCRLSC